MSNDNIEANGENASPCDVTDMEVTASDSGNAAIDVSGQDIEDRIYWLMSTAEDGEATPADYAELDRLLIADVQHGGDYPFRVLGIRNDRELMTFVALRDQAAKDYGANTVLEHMLLNAILGTSHLLDRSMQDSRRCQDRIDELLGLRPDTSRPDVVTAMRYMADLDTKYSVLQDRMVRNLCRLVRTFSGLRRSNVTYQIKVTDLRNLNVADQQMNLQTPERSDAPVPKQSE